MRNWLSLYLCLLLVFIFIPMKLSDYNYLIGHESRAPSSFNEASTCYGLLKSFYSKERNLLLDSRLKYTEDDSHLFFRSFPPLYFKFMENQSWKTLFPAVAKIESVMAGDVHMENFGLKYFKGILRLSVNDYDDLTTGPLFLDIVRLLTSAKLAGVEIDKSYIQEFMATFIKGLEGKKHSYSDVVNELIEESEKISMLDAKAIDKVTKTFSKKKEPNVALKSEELKVWKNLINDFGEIKDSYSFTKQFGGSGGLKRFEFVVEKDNKVYWIEAKEWADPSYNIAQKSNPPTDKKRYGWIMEYDSPIIAPTITKFDGQTYYVRNIDARQTGIEVAKLKKSEKEDVLIDEAYALGQFHRTYLADPSEFIKALDTIRSGDLLDYIQAMAKDVKQNQNSLK
ncbi:MAG: DUF2252 family protein [Bdellovibrionales bacterium]|nr:DUF2252 family protein [Bdellovibrionales bacterium]